MYIFITTVVTIVIIIIMIFRNGEIVHLIFNPNIKIHILNIVLSMLYMQ